MSEEFPEDGGETSFIEGEEGEELSRRTPRGNGSASVEGRRRMTIAIAVMVPVLILAAVLVSRREDDSGTAKGGPDPLATYCAAVVERDSIRIPVPEEEPSEEATNSIAIVAGRLILVTERMLEVAPDEAKAELEHQVSSYRELVRTRDQAGFTSQELLNSRSEVNAVDVDRCGLSSVEVSATEYRYDGISERIDQGKTTFRLSNRGEQLHEIVLFRRGPEAEGEFSSILAEGTEGEQATVVASTHAPSGTSNVLTVDLEGGQYAIACLLSSGNQPHWRRGMIVEFSVQ